jgi:hypothetical protein
MHPTKRRYVDRKPWAPNCYVTEGGYRLPADTQDRDFKLAAARTTIALLHAGARVPRPSR